MKPWKSSIHLHRHSMGILCFNGATAMKPWKRWTWQTYLYSDGKLQWGHGDEAVEERIDRLRSKWEIYGFNGATAMKPWKSCLAPAGRTRCRASMGPRR